MNRYFLEIKYDGTNYHGWQIQKNSNTVQSEINNALSTLLQQTIVVYGAGRTDTGVHAKQLFAHFEIENQLDIAPFLFKINSFLPEDISCKSIQPVNKEAHARFSATSRSYEYWITPTKDPFCTNRAYFLPYQLDIELMNAACKKLLGEQDFSCFSRSNTDTFTNNCNLTFAKWEQKNELIVFTITANRFLRNMVRAIVGTLLTIGQQKATLNDLALILASKNRSNAGTSAPAYGLYLTEVNYPKEVYNV
jgi:tRNA pseudouridine38-40 synthase